MKNSKLIALSAISTAFALIFLLAGAYFDVLEYSAIFMASLCMLLPLTKNSYLGAFLSYLATSILAVVLVAGRWNVVLPFVSFFGLHPIVNHFQKSKNLNKVISFIVKDIWFVGVLILSYIVLEDFIIIDIEIIQKYIYPALIVGGTLLFLIYDFMMFKFQKGFDILIKRFRL